jgi:hypothetical protein
MMQVRVEGHDKCGSTMDDSHPHVGMTVNSAFVSFGTTEKALEIEVVAREARIIAADEEPFFKRAHHLGHLDANRVGFGFEFPGERVKSSFAVLPCVGYSAQLN